MYVCRYDIPCSGFPDLDPANLPTLLPHEALHLPRFLRPPEPPAKKHVAGGPVEGQEPERFKPEAVVVVGVEDRTDSGVRV